jgi:endonuclease-3 related protein
MKFAVTTQGCMAPGASPQHWWPANSRFEVIAGAFLIQNTSWRNAELALKRLRSAGMLNIMGLRRISLDKLGELIRPAGHFRQKAQRLKTFVTFVDQNYAGSLSRMFAQPTHALRQQLLALSGVGPETADSILLYAGDHPVFVVDSYARRILSRHEVIRENAPYEAIAETVQAALVPLSEENIFAASETVHTIPPEHKPSPVSRRKRPALVQVYNEMHAFIVGVGKRYCRKQTPDCENCPLRPFLKTSSPLSTRRVSSSR